MTYDEMTALIEGTIIPELLAARAAGQKEYAHGARGTFDNFERTAEVLGLSREEVLAIFMLKHIDGITSYVKGHRSQREDVRGRIKDAIVYLMLLWGMVEDRERQELP